MQSEFEFMSLKHRKWLEVANETEILDSFRRIIHNSPVHQYDS